jgi:preprotein translocase subunit SecB
MERLMAEASHPLPSSDANTESGAITAPNMQIMSQFIRDLSFENPRAPASLRPEKQPEVDVGVEMNARGRNDGLFEVDLKISVTAKSDDAPMFAVEVLYGGLFQLSNIPENMMEPTLLVECPRYLFPFVRRIIADCTTDGGFTPPFFLEPIDFASLYMAQKQQAQGQT